jgi:hypothetical protein
VAVLYAFQFCCAWRTLDREDVTDMLVQQFETVFVTDGKLLSAESSRRGTPAQVLMPFAGLIRAVGERTSLAAYGLLHPGTVEYVAVGAKNFRPPVGLGAVLSDTCYVLRLSKKGSVDLQRSPPGPMVPGSAGPPVWSWRADTDDQTSAVFYISQPLRDYIIVANNLEDLLRTHAHITEGRARQNNTRHLLNAHPKRLQIRRAPVWGYRAYRHGVSTDSKQASGLLEAGASARTLIFFANPEIHRAWLELTLAEDSEDAVAGLRRLRPLLAFERSRAGVWEAPVPLGSSAAEQERLFVAMSLFGFGVYL